MTENVLVTGVSDITVYYVTHLTLSPPPPIASHHLVPLEYPEYSAGSPDLAQIKPRRSQVGYYDGDEKKKKM